MPCAYWGIQIMKNEVRKSIPNKLAQICRLIEGYKSKKLINGKLGKIIGMLYNNNLFNINYTSKLKEARLKHGKGCQ